jgi:hypothetical protein
LVYVGKLAQFLRVVKPYKERDIIVRSPYGNFNIVLVAWLYSELSKKGYRLCLYGVEEFLSNAKNLCGIEYPTTPCQGVDVAIAVGEADLLTAFDSNATTRIYIVFRGSLRRRESARKRRTYYVKNVGGGVYIITRRVGGEVPELYAVKVEECSLRDYSLPQSVVEVYSILREVVQLYGGSIKASEFLKHLVKARGFDREGALSAIRLAIKLGLVKYFGGYLTPL